MAPKIKYSSLQLAFLGDAVYELAIRRLALQENLGHVDKLNRFTKKRAMAVTQAAIADFFAEEEVLTEEEAAVYKRGRNAKSASLPKSCTPAQYRKATGVEALFGFLFLEDKQARIDELLTLALKKITI